jgi:hypothetical protein
MSTPYILDTNTFFNLNNVAMQSMNLQLLGLGILIDYS